MDYKETLLMPKTEFPMRGNLGIREVEFQKKWNELNLYNERLRLNEGNNSFILHDGPPYANGDIHTGHVLNKTLKDFVLRFKSMRGFYTPFVPGWDTHGLPIETQVTKSGVDRKQISTLEFRAKCHEYALVQVERQKNQFKRLGILGDWDKPYLTLDKEFESAQIKIFGTLVEKKIVYKGLKPVYWSPSSETALAEAEIEYHNKESESIYFTFKIINNKELTNVNLLIWTTTPWTLPANLAVAVNPRFNYQVILADNKKYLVLDKMVPILTKKLQFKNVKIIKDIKGTKLENIEYKHPLYDRVSPIILGDHVTAEDGTGLVHTAPGHGEDDFIVGQKYHLDILVPVDSRGIMNAAAGKYEGEFYEKANIQIIDDLKDNDALVFHETINHSYPHDWRTKKPIIFLATPQWFINLEAIKEDLLTAVKNVEWLPKWGEIRLSNMMQDRSAWCISRQRVWGVPIPIIYSEKGEPIMDVKLINHFAAVFAKHGSDAWYRFDINQLLPTGYKHKDSPNNIFTKETDTMDVWFDAGSSHYMLNKRSDLKFPADLYLEGADQYRGWFNSSLITSVIVNGVAPYKLSISHGFLLDNHGNKMSKSLGNVIEPLKIIDQQGADLLRLWVATVDYRSDVRISDEIMKQVAEGYRKIRNTMRFMLGNLDDFEYEKNYVSYSMRDRVSQALYGKFTHTINECIKAYEAYEFDKVYRLLVPFIINEISSFYLDYTKDILYIEKENAFDRRVIQSTIYDFVINILKILTPIIPHTTSEAYWLLKGHTRDDIYLTNITELSVPDSHAVYQEELEQLIAIREVVLKELELKRAEKLINKSLTAEVTLTLTPKQIKTVNFFNTKLAQLLQVAKISVNVGDETTVLVTKFDGITCARCWNVVQEINSDELCPRCQSVLEE